MFYEAQQAVKEFHRMFGLPISETLTKLQKARVELRARWMQEEIEEFLRAEDIVDQIDAISDLIYFAIGVFVEMGVDGSRPFEFIHQANMSKIGRNGVPIYNRDGKVMKPDSWIPPRDMIRQWLRNNY